MKRTYVARIDLSALTRAGNEAWSDEPIEPLSKDAITPMAVQADGYEHWHLVARDAAAAARLVRKHLWPELAVVDITALEGSES